MPELPEVETVVLGLKREVLNRKIIDVWTDFLKMIKSHKSFSAFKKEIIGTKIKNIERVGKNIVFQLSNGKYLLIHQKLTGHLLLGKWKKEGKKWVSEIEGPLKEDPMNTFLHFILFLDDGRQIALSDLRKFAKILLLDEEGLKKELSGLGVDPLSREFTFSKFWQILKTAKNRKIKQLLMDQSKISGIGNIYSDEVLWKSKIHPLFAANKISPERARELYKNIKEILKKAIRLGGESISDFRKIDGTLGGFDKERAVYRREGQPCSRCKTKIERIKINGRSSYFCPKCQRL